MTLLPGMRALTFRATAIVVASLSLLSFVTAAAAAPASPAGGMAHAIAQAGNGGHNVWPVAGWTIVGALIFALVFGILYLFKRRVGGFPEHPDWVAPISIERSETFPKEGDYADAAPAPHGAHH